MNPNFERDSLMAVFYSKRVWLINVIANALLFALFFYWLQIQEDTGAWFAATLIIGLLIVFVALLVHGATFDYFRARTEPSLVSRMRRIVPRVPVLLAWAVAFGVALWLLAQLWDYTAQAGGWARHALPGLLRGRVSPRSVISAASGLVWFAIFFLIPIIFLPIGSRIASFGLRGVFSREAWKPVRELRFWGLYAICFLAGAYLPYRLAYMTPSKASPLSVQGWSMVMRLGIGYLLFITAWITLCAAIARATRDPETAVRANG